VSINVVAYRSLSSEASATQTCEEATTGNL
jgi:hypothetical protein